MSARNDIINDHPQVIQMKADAGKLRRDQPTISHAQALEVLARSRGFNTYAGFRQSLRDSQ